MWLSLNSKGSRGQMAMANSNMLPWKPVPEPTLRPPLPTVHQDNKGGNSRIRDDVTQLCKSLHTHNGSVQPRLRWQARLQREKAFFLSKTALKVPAIYFHAWTLESLRYKPWHRPSRGSVPTLQATVHSGQDEFNPYWDFTTKSELCEYCSANSLKSSVGEWQ